MQDIAIANGMQDSPEIEKREGLLIGHGASGKIPKSLKCPPLIKH